MIILIFCMEDNAEKTGSSNKWGLRHFEQRGPEHEEFQQSGVLCVNGILSQFPESLIHKTHSTADIVDAFWLGKCLSAISPETDYYFPLSHIVETRLVLSGEK